MSGRGCHFFPEVASKREGTERERAEARLQPFEASREGPSHAIASPRAMSTENSITPRPTLASVVSSFAAANTKLAGQPSTFIFFG